MTLIDLSLPVLALLLLGIVLYNVRSEKRRDRSADQTATPVSMRDVQLHDFIDVNAQDDNRVANLTGPFDGFSRH